MAARLVGVLLLALIASLQYGLWFGKGSWLRVWEIDRKLAQQHRINESMAARNAGGFSIQTCSPVCIAAIARPG